MKHLYFFDEINKNAAIYGVNTYKETLLSILKSTDFKITVITILSETETVIIRSVDNIRYISIPHLYPAYSSKKHYYRSVFYILFPYISFYETNIFHLNYLSSMDLAMQLRINFPDSKIVLTIHYRQLDTSENIDNEKKMINIYCDKIIVLSEHASTSLQKDYFTKTNKISIIPNALQDEYTVPSIIIKNNLKNKFGINFSEKIILFAGRLDDNKNASIVIRAFLLLSRKHNIRLIIAGSGNFDNLLSIINHSWGKIVFTGFLNKNMLYDLYKITDLGIIPSIYEEFGYIAIEMMMHRIPIIANKTSGLSDIIEDGISGKLLDLNTHTDIYAIELLAICIHELLENEKLCFNLSYNARNRFLNKFEISSFKNIMLQFYNSL